MLAGGGRGGRLLRGLQPRLLQGHVAVTRRKWSSLLLRLPEQAPGRRGRSGREGRQMHQVGAHGRDRGPRSADAPPPRRQVQPAPAGHRRRARQQDGDEDRQIRHPHRRLGRHPGARLRGAFEVEGPAGAGAHPPEPRDDLPGGAAGGGHDADGPPGAARYVVVAGDVAPRPRECASPRRWRSVAFAQGRLAARPRGRPRRREDGQAPAEAHARREVRLPVVRGLATHRGAAAADRACVCQAVGPLAPEARQQADAG
mmetsp:Transcript_105239/g.322595  ORF Transcript_105239/g.322595 Transcript_105239/m.322595 type:complete len:257 (-) Transcript_105239:628-1398(-)